MRRDADVEPRQSRCAPLGEAEGALKAPVPLLGPAMNEPPASGPRGQSEPTSASGRAPAWDSPAVARPHHRRLLRAKRGSDVHHARSHDKQQRAACRTTHLQWNESRHLGAAASVAGDTPGFVPLRREIEDLRGLPLLREAEVERVPVSVSEQALRLAECRSPGKQRSHGGFRASILETDGVTQALGRRRCR